MNSVTLPMLIATVSTQRSGTKFLGSCFGAGTQIRPFGEIFHPTARFLTSFSTFVCREGYLNLIAQDSDKILDNFFSCFLAEKMHFDVMFSQLEIPCISWNSLGADFLYEYLKSRRAVVISLERPPAECFISAKFVELGGAPHYFAGRNFENNVPAEHILNVDEFTAYLRRTREQRQRLIKSMKDYDFFYRLEYEMLSEVQGAPPDLIDLIARAAKLLNKQLDERYTQVHQPNVVRSPVRYDKVFQNYAEIFKMQDQL